MEKPEIFYHASSIKDLEELEPQPTRLLDGKEALFGTPDIAGATMFLTRVYDDTSKKGYADGFYYFVISDKEKFTELDKGGTVYVLPGAKFTTSEKLWGREWIAEENVKPMHKIHFDSSLRAMIENGVKVYFTDKKTFEDKIKGKSCSIVYLEQELGLKSEN